MAEKTLSDIMLGVFDGKASEDGTAIGTSCLICGDVVAIQLPWETHKICVKCKAAVLKMRSSMEQEG